MTRSSTPTAAACLVVLVVYAALTAALAWPLVDDLGGRLAGYSSDVYMNQWVDWWTQKALSGNLDLYHTNYIFYPDSTSLVFHSFSYVNTAIATALSPLIGQVAAYNVMILLSYPLSAFAMYLLARELTGCKTASFLAGLVYAFQPYHIFESAHPIIVSTQWMPLFILALRRMLRARSTFWLGQVLLAALWFVLTALSSWHLMSMLAALAILLVGYEALSARSSWKPGAALRLFALGAVVAAVLIAFLWPMLHEQLAGDAAYMAVSAEDGVSNDVLSLFIPNRRHPLGSLVAGLHERIGFSTRRPGYLGYAALALAIVAVQGAWHDTRFWLLSAVVFLVLSLGLRVEWGGAALHGFQLPWAPPIIALLRNPFRLNVLVFLSLAVLVAFGWQVLWRRLSSCHRAVAGGAAVGIVLLVVAEYLVVPFPTTEPLYSPFVHYLAQQDDASLAVADFPMGRQPGKYYMYLQTMHGHHIMDGHVSRTPVDAYDYVDSHPLLAALRADAPPSAEIKIDEQLDVLSAEGIAYLVLHKRLPNADGLWSWPLWMDALHTPVYADEWLVAYVTDPAARSAEADSPEHVADIAVGDSISLLGYTVDPTVVHGAAPLYVTLFWTSDGTLTQDYHVFVHLLDPAGQLVSQHDMAPAYDTRPVSTWQAGEVIRDDHMLFIAPGLAPGEYTISVGMYGGLTLERLPAVTSDGARLPEDRIVLCALEVVVQ